MMSVAKHQQSMFSDYRWMSFSSCVCLLVCLWVPPALAAPESTLILNASIIDGTGASARLADLRISGEVIADIGELDAAPEDQVVDGTGLVLAPGFIDTHSHHDIGMFLQPEMLTAVSQGITTIVRGMDGGIGLGGSYAGLAAFTQQLERTPVAVNVASFAPHGEIRRRVLGADFARAATAAEQAAMEALVAADMQAGALGLNTGLEYEPGIHATTEEVIALAKVAARFGGRYASHMRDEDDRFFDALEELIHIGQEAKLPVHVSHIKLADMHLWGSTGRAIKLMDGARERGIQVSADIYPYLYWQSNLAVLFPDRDYQNVQAAEFTFSRTTTPHDLSLTFFAPEPAWVGKNVAEIAALLDRSPIQTLLQLAQMSDAHLKQTGKPGDSIIAKSMNADDVRAFMRWHGTNICSDGGLNGGHPRGAGAFPRVLSHFVGAEGLTLEQAIHKMSGLSAKNAGIAGRGVIEAGAFADLVLFDPNSVRDKATFDEPKLLATGISQVWVNGQVVYAGGKATAARPGKFVGRAPPG